MTKASKPSGPPSWCRSNTNCAGSAALERKASMGWRKRACGACRYTVLKASCCRPRVCASQSCAAVPLPCTSRAASCGGQASTTRSNVWQVSVRTSQPEAIGVIACTRTPRPTQPPCAASHASAASGSSALKSRRGSSRFEPPLWANSASRITRKKTCPQARSAGVFSADTHKGSISDAIALGARPRHKSLTD